MKLVKFFILPAAFIAVFFFILTNEIDNHSPGYFQNLKELPSASQEYTLIFTDSTEGRGRVYKKVYTGVNPSDSLFAMLLMHSDYRFLTVYEPHTGPIRQSFEKYMYLWKYMEDIKGQVWVDQYKECNLTGPDLYLKLYEEVKSIRKEKERRKAQVKKLGSEITLFAEVILISQVKSHTGEVWEEVISNEVVK